MTSNDPHQLPEPQQQPEGREETPDAGTSTGDESGPKKRILIGSQRDPAAYRRRTTRDWEPVDQPPDQSQEKETPGQPRSDTGAPKPPAPVADEPPRATTASPAPAQPVEELSQGPARSESPAPAPPEPAIPAEPAILAEPGSPELEPVQRIPPSEDVAVEATPSEPTRREADAGAPPSPKPVGPVDEVEAALESLESPSASSEAGLPSPGSSRGPRLPNLRRDLSDDLARQYEDALGEESMEDLLQAGDQVTRQEVIEPESRHTGRVIHVHRDDVFIELGGREQGIVPTRLFDEPPELGTEIEVVVSRFNAEDGVYELSLPSMAADVQDWSDLSEGMLVSVRVTGHNTGGLECEVNHIRGFIPVSQIALYRVEDLAEFADQKFTCLVTEANPNRGNLVLSRRAVLEKEREEARQQLLDSLEPGEIREGIVRKLMDFGAFVELGHGVDGLLHISQLAWARVEHPSEVLHEGQTIQVKIDKVDKETKRIGLGYREMLENPWTHAAERYPVDALIRVRVTKLMEFGAFAELEPGVEGLVHISELSHKRVWRTSDAVHEGDEVEVLVLSVDVEAQRMSLSMKQALPEPEKPTKDDKDQPAEAAPLPRKLRQKSDEPLKGGTGGSTGGEQFGLKW